MSALRRVHVLHVADPTTVGTADVVLGQVRDQVGRGWQVSVVCPSLGPLGYAAREVGAEVRWWRTGPGHPAGEALRLASVVGESRPDVVHLHGARAGLVGRLAVRGRVPTLHQPHGTWAADRWERWADRWTTGLVLATDAQADEAGEALGLQAPVTRLALGVDLERHHPADQRDRHAARHRLGLADAPTAVLVAGTAQDEQDLRGAWPAVRARVPDAELVVVGARTDVPLWLAASDVVVVPAHDADARQVSLEAMATARSVVAWEGSDSAGAVARRLADPEVAAAEGREGRAQVEQHHDRAATHRELARLCLRLVAAARGR